MFGVRVGVSRSQLCVHSCPLNDTLTVVVSFCRYDIMNDVMSASVHRLWKDYFVETIGPVLSRGASDRHSPHIRCSYIVFSILQTNL